MADTLSRRRPGDNGALFYRCNASIRAQMGFGVRKLVYKVCAELPRTETNEIVGIVRSDRVSITPTDRWEGHSDRRNHPRSGDAASRGSEAMAVCSADHPTTTEVQFGSLLHH